jgi:hypothetical protein
MAERRGARRARWPLGSLLIAAVALVALLALARSGGSNFLVSGAAGTATTGATPSPGVSLSPGPLPTGGLPQDEAVSIAQKAAPTNAVFESVRAETFASVDPRVGEGLSIPPDHYVWVVTFAATAAPCPPGGSTCESPRPGTVTVLLDYLTGERYVTAGNYPNPNP